MKPNFGRTTELIGRDRLISEIWRLLQFSSLVLLGPRRIGKTSLIRNMFLEQRKGYRCEFADTTPYQSLPEFLIGILNLKIFQGGKKWHPKTISEKRDLKTQHLIDQISEQLKATCSDASRYIVFAFDEFPEFLSNLSAEESEKLLSAFRRMRMENDNFRVIFIGETLNPLMNRVSHGNFINDMRIVEIPPLSGADSSMLAEKLLEDTGIDYDPEIGKKLAELSGGLPFYIQVLANELKTSMNSSKRITTKEVDSLTAKLITSPLDPFNLNRLRHLIDRAYSKYEKDTALLLLQDLASKKPETLRNFLVHNADLNYIISNLEQDGILSNIAGKLAFQNKIIEQWVNNAFHLPRESSKKATHGNGE